MTRRNGREKTGHVDTLRITNFRSLVFWAVGAYLVLHVIDTIAATIILPSGTPLTIPSSIR